MGIASIGSVFVGGPGGRSGVVVDARPAPGPSDHDRVAVRISSPDTAAPSNSFQTGQSPTGETLSSLRVELADAIRQSDAAKPAVARTPDQLAPQDRTIVEQLRQRDAQVRQEENAHAGGAGSLAGPISYVYRRGPDGRRYAVGGSVPITIRSVTGDPAEARRLGGKLAAAALAATNPSAADLAAAARAYRFGGAETVEFRADSPSEAKRGSTLDRQA